ncbi:MAG: redoxin domain-containing protein [Acidobacteria bacterium]|nr:redoxin domain-containing protein [Acidobacteriota bacterium]
MSSTMPAEGARAPSFSVTAHDGSTVTLSQFAGKKHVVLFFYPKADTPG